MTQLLNLTHPFVGQETVGRRIISVQESAPDPQIMRVQEVLQLLPHREIGKLLIFKITWLFGFQAFDLFEEREGPPDAKVELIAPEIQLKQALLRRIACELPFNFLARESPQQVVHSDPKKRITGHQTVIQKCEWMI